MHYSVFNTRWGWFGLLADDAALRRVCLPMADKAAVLSFLLADLQTPPKQTKTLGDSQERVCAYFEG